MKPENKIVWDAVKGNLWFSIPLVIITLMAIGRDGLHGGILAFLIWVLWAETLVQEVEIALLKKLGELRDIEVVEE